jgi:hypothetical protein
MDPRDEWTGAGLASLEAYSGRLRGAGRVLTDDEQATLISTLEALEAGDLEARFAAAVRPDAVDFRDREYTPTLAYVPRALPVEAAMARGVPIEDQRTSLACTGFALQAVAHHLMWAAELDEGATGSMPADLRVSAQMFWDLARRYDEFPGDDQGGSTVRAAIKGWHKHGVCAEQVWDTSVPGEEAGVITTRRAEDAAERPLGAYFRVDPTDLVAIHAALAEAKVLLAAVRVHAGWYQLFDVEQVEDPDTKEIISNLQLVVDLLGEIHDPPDRPSGRIPFPAPEFPGGTPAWSRA